VYVTKDKRGKRKYIYKIEPPATFIALTIEIKKINDILIKTEDPDENNRLFEQLIEISKKMQNMRKEDYEPI
jgi:hypothetical protein